MALKAFLCFLLIFKVIRNEQAITNAVPKLKIIKMKKTFYEFVINEKIFMKEVIFYKILQHLTALCFTLKFIFKFNIKR